MRKGLEVNMKRKKRILFPALPVSSLLSGRRPGKDGSRHKRNGVLIRVFLVVLEKCSWVGRSGADASVPSSSPITHRVQAYPQAIKASPGWGRDGHRSS